MSKILALQKLQSSDPVSGLGSDSSVNCEFDSNPGSHCSVNCE
jgi:hypothetical protein